MDLGYIAPCPVCGGKIKLYSHCGKPDCKAVVCVFFAAPRGSMKRVAQSSLPQRGQGRCQSYIRWPSTSTLSVKGAVCPQALQNTTYLRIPELFFFTADIYTSPLSAFSANHFKNLDTLREWRLWTSSASFHSDATIGKAYTCILSPESKKGRSRYYHLSLH